MPRIALLDVNALLALIDEQSAFHLPAHDWFKEAQSYGWATCSITESGVLRVATKPAYPNGPLPLLELARRIENAKKSPTYVFCEDALSTAEWVHSTGLMIPSSKMTDAHLLKLASKHQRSEEHTSEL